MLLQTRAEEIISPATMKLRSGFLKGNMRRKNASTLD
jgi:hypothetical protein